MTERELFEKWFEEENLNCKISQLNDMDYWADKIDYSWEAWKASFSREGYALIPVEMSQVKAEELATSEWNKNKSLFYSYNRELTAFQAEEFRLRWCKAKARTIMNDYKAMVKENKYESL